MLRPSRTSCTYFFAGFFTLGVIAMVYITQISDISLTRSYSVINNRLGFKEVDPTEISSRHDHLTYKNDLPIEGSSSHDHLTYKNDLPIEGSSSHDHLTYQKDLPVLYLSDVPVKERDRAMANVTSRRTEPLRPGSVMTRLLKSRIHEDYRFCRISAPFVGPFNYIPKSKSPCWYSSTGELQCVPYFYLAGFSKCGTTDLFNRISAHPEVIGGNKEKHWLDYTRYFENKESIHYYATSFARATDAIKKKIGEKGTSKITIGDGTPCYAWHSLYWHCYEGNRGLTEPKYTNPDVIYRMNPKAKIIMLLRDPVTRLYSRYLTWINKLDYPAFTDPSPYQFHKNSEEAIKLYNNCFRQWSHRHCAYNGTLYTVAKSRLQEGMYSVYIKDWLRVFPRNQLLIMKFEDYVTKVPEYLHKIYRFLDLEPLPDASVVKISKLKAGNVGTHYSIGPLMNETRDMLRKFYAPFIRELQSLLGDSKWSWGYE